MKKMVMYARALWSLLDYAPPPLPPTPYTLTLPDTQRYASHHRLNMSEMHTQEITQAHARTTLCTSIYSAVDSCFKQLPRQKGPRIHPLSASASVPPAMRKCGITHAPRQHMHIYPHSCLRSLTCSQTVEGSPRFHI